MALLAIPHDELQLMTQMLQQQQEDRALLQQKRIQRRPRRLWVRPWIGRRLEFGQYHNLMAELEREHHGDFTNYLHMDRTVAKADPEADEEGYQLLSRTVARAQAGDHFEVLGQWPYLPHSQLCLYGAS